MDFKKFMGSSRVSCRKVVDTLKSRWPGFAAKTKAVGDELVRSAKKRPGFSAGIAVAVVVFILAVRIAFRDSGAADGSESLLYEITRGPLTISVTASGTIENREKVIVRNSVVGARSTILWLIEEGKSVKAGDLLVDFDSSGFEESLLDANVNLDSITSQVVRASETLAITQNQAEADVEKAELNLKFARLALEKYIEGDYPQDLQKAETDITIAKEELRRSEERLQWSARLAEQDFITRSEYEADELALKKKQIELQMAEKRLHLLEKYSNVVQEERLKSDVVQAELALDRVKRKAKADILQAEVDLRSKEMSLSRHIERFTRLKEQIANCKVYAPVDGLVVYATSMGGGGRRWRNEPLAEGATVNERQELIYLPTTGAMNVIFDVQEGSLGKVAIGVPAVITADALPGRTYTGRVKRVAPLPDTSQSWLNPDLKVYNCQIEIESSIEGLRPGLSCNVEVLYQQLEDVIFVPVQSVVLVDDHPAVFVMTSRGPAPRKVEIGLDNNRMVHIISGLEKGESVLLSPPLRAAERKEQIRVDLPVEVAPHVEAVPERADQAEKTERRVDRGGVGQGDNGDVPARKERRRPEGGARPPRTGTVAE